MGSFSERLPYGGPAPILGVRGVPIGGLWIGVPEVSALLAVVLVAGGVAFAFRWLRAKDARGRSRPIARVLAATLATLFALVLLAGAVETVVKGQEGTLSLALMGGVLGAIAVGLWTGKLDPSDEAPDL